MARKNKDTRAEAETEAEVMDQAPTPEEPFISDEETTGLGELDTDFDLEEEYKPEPLVPGGNYRGNVVGVVPDIKGHNIAFKVVLADNGGVLSDGETPIDGWAGYKRIWLPKPGDENELTKDGRQTKRQSKINMMTRFAEGMKINMNTPKIIATAIQNQDWIGLPVIVAIGMSEFEGNTRNELNKMVAVTGEIAE